jgi:hypothetical protein
MDPVILKSNFQAPIETISNFQYKVVRNFDSDLSPEHPANQEAAQQRGLVYSPNRASYIDEDGCLIRDRFGQPY